MQGYQATMVRWADQRPWAGETLQQAIERRHVLAKSAHATFARGGRVVSHVPIDSRSWAAGAANRPTWEGLGGWSRSVNHLVANVECEGFAKVPGYGYDYIYDAKHPWPNELLDSLTDWLVWWFQQQTHLVPSGETIIGHRDTDSVTRADDPGSAFPMPAIIQIVKARLSPESPSEPPDAEHGHQGLVDDITGLRREQVAQAGEIRAIQTRQDRHLAS